MYNTIKSSFDIHKRNNVPGFENIKLLNRKQKPPNLKKRPTKVELSNEETVVKKCQDSQCEYSKFLLLSK